MVHLWYLVFSKHILSSKFLQQDSTIYLFNRYTVFSMFFQFLVPVVIISTIYIRILLYLKVRRLFLLQYNPQNHILQILIVKSKITNYKLWSNYKMLTNIWLQSNRVSLPILVSKQRKTNVILFSIAITFFITWLPFRYFLF